jgi:hypothetical protein
LGNYYLSRLTGAAYSENGSASTHYGTSYQYDLMGNITGLTRNGLQDDNSYGLIDNLSFDYNGNQLLKVTDAVTSGPNYSGAFHFNDHSDVSQEYEYDLNGNMTKDRNKKITSVEYNVLNLPEKITFASDSILYEYAADGRKVKVMYPYTLHPFPPLGVGEHCGTRKAKRQGHPSGCGRVGGIGKRRGANDTSRARRACRATTGGDARGTASAGRGCATGRGGGGRARIGAICPRSRPGATSDELSATIRRNRTGPPRRACSYARAVTSASGVCDAT